MSPGTACGESPYDQECGDTFVRVTGIGEFLRACRGDSGGPVYSGNYAAGIFTHYVEYNGTGCTHPSSTATIYFQPMSAVQAVLGVTLFTG